jgi:hypothetical protein
MHAVRNLGRVAALLCVVLLSAQAANAQSTAAITLSAGTPGAWTAGTATVPITVSLKLENVICPQAGTATVNLSYTDPTPIDGLTFSLPSSVAFTVPQGAHSSAGPYNAPPQTVNLTATATASVLPNHVHTLNVTATFTATGLGAPCQAAAATAPLGDTKTVEVSITTPMGSGPGGNGTQTTGPTGTGTGTTSKPAITLPFAVQVGAIVGLGALMVRRKK